MWPPSSAEPPLSARLARITIASAFQRISAARRCSIARSPGNGGCSSSAIVLTYGVISDGCQCTPRRRACGEQGVEQVARARRSVGGGQRVERFAPFGGLGRIGIGAAAGENRADVAGERKIGHATILRRREGSGRVARHRRGTLT